MHNLDLVNLALRNLARRKSRTALTVLSVIIGCISIILMLSIGFGIHKREESYMDMAGSSLTSINLHSTYYEDPSSDKPLPTKGVMTEDVVKKIQTMAHVKSVFPLMTVQSNISTKEKGIELWTGLTAFDPQFIPDDAVTLDGKKIKDLKKNEFIVGSRVFPVKQAGGKQGYMNFEELYDWDWAKHKYFFPIGYKESGLNVDGLGGGKTYEEIKADYYGSFSGSKLLVDFNIYISLETAQEINKKSQEIFEGQNQPSEPVKKKNKKKKPLIYNEVIVEVDHIDNVEAVKEQIMEDFQLEGYSNTEFIKQQQERMFFLQLILGGIGSIALFVAAIGIANTMLMSIQERKKEIGVMKVIGAQVRDIRRIFLLESGLIGVLGGLLGTAIAYGASMGINSLAAVSAEEGMDMVAMAAEPIPLSYIPYWLPFLAIIFSALIGIIAGYLPAKKATKLSAIEAIRNG